MTKKLKFRNRAYYKQGEAVEKADKFVAGNAYPLACNVISGLDSKERSKFIYTYLNGKVGFYFNSSHV
jgi:hypothetical protein